jgi:hypothetical protein
VYPDVLEKFFDPANYNDKPHRRVVFSAGQCIASLQCICEGLSGSPSSKVNGWHILIQFVASLFTATNVDRVLLSGDLLRIIFLAVKTGMTGLMQ